jgi:5-methyltetrahydrofolate--homocysteine methyltransferase
MVLERTIRDEERQARVSEFRSLLKQRILVLDCAMGTMIQGYGLSEEDYRGERFKDHPRELKGDNDLLSITQPRIIRDIHEAVLEVGADIIETNTFNATAVSQSDYGTEDLAYELNLAASRARPRTPSPRGSPRSRASSPAPSARRTAPPPSPPT